MNLRKLHRAALITIGVLVTAASVASFAESYRAVPVGGQHKQYAATLRRFRSALGVGAALAIIDGAAVRDRLRERRFQHRGLRDRPEPCYRAVGERQRLAPPHASAPLATAGGAL